MGKRRAKGEGGITQRKDGLWMATLTVGRDSKGKPKRKYFYGKDKAEVTKKLNDAQYDVRHGQYKDTDKTTLGQWLDEWLEVWKTDLKPTTRESYEYLIDRHIKPEFEFVALANLNETSIQKFFNDKKKSGLSPRTVKYIHSVMSGALKKAVDLKMINSNPARNISLPAQEQKEIKFFDSEQIGTFLKLAKDDDYYPAYLLELYTGMRRGELLAVRWSDLDLKEGVVTVSRGLVRTKDGLIFQKPKTRYGKRDISIPSEVCDVLTFHKSKQKKQKEKAGVAWTKELLFTGKKPVENDLVFTNRIGEPLDPRAFSSHFKNLIAGTELEGVTFHGLRHSFAILCLQEGVDPRTTQENLGHHDPGFTLKVYSQATKKMKKDAVDKISKVINGN